MAKALDVTRALSASQQQVRSRSLLLAERLVLGSVVLFGSFLALLGTCWDIQWHDYVGRDRTLIPPHVMSLVGITLCGLAVLISVFFESAAVRKQPSLAALCTNFAGLFHASLGAYISGYAALVAGVAFPLDSYWHALYGIDVAIWAPFHVMILVAAACMPLGAIYMLATVARLAERTGDTRTARRGYAGAIVSLAVMFGIFTYLLLEGIYKVFHLSGITFSLFPVLSGILVAWILATAIYAFPSRWAATRIALIYLLFIVIFQLFVPPATNTLVTSEGLHFVNARAANAANLSVVALALWPLAPIIVALLIDWVCALARRNGWSSRRLTLIIALCCLPACIPLTIVPEVPGPMIITVGVRMIMLTGVIGFPISLLLGFAGVYAGVLLGQRMGTFLRVSKR